jgi:hypothetical protein
MIADIKMFSYAIWILPLIYVCIFWLFCLAISLFMLSKEKNKYLFGNFIEKMGKLYYYHKN